MKKKFFGLILILTSTQINAQDIEAFILNVPEKQLENVHKIAVLNFEGQEGQLMPDLINEELAKENRGIFDQQGDMWTKSKKGVTYINGAKTNCLQIVDKGQLQNALNQQSITNNGVITEEQASKLGQLLSFDAMITGKVSFTSNDEQKKTTYDNGSYDLYSTRTVKTEVTVKIISTANGQILGTKSFTAAYYATNTAKNQPSYPGFPDVNPLIDKGLKEIAPLITNYFVPYYTKSVFKFDKIKVKEVADKAKEASKYLEKGDLNNAFSIYKAIYDADNYNANAAYNLGLLYMMVGDDQEAKNYLEIAYQLNNDNDYKKVLDYSIQRQSFANIFKIYGINVEKYEFKTNSNALAEKVRISGSKSDRFDVYTTPNGTEVVAKVPGDTEFVVLKKDGDWILIQLLGGKQGYINKKNTK